MDIAARAKQLDPYTQECVLCNAPCEGRSEFCKECIEQGEEDDNFGRCYQCRDYHDHENCVGVPCQCPCPLPDQVKKQAEINAVLKKLTPYERSLLGH